MPEPSTRLSLQEVLGILEGTPSRLAAATAGQAAGRLLEPLEAGGWSARDILGHVRACHMTWAGYVLRILDEDRPSFRAESPRGTIHRTDFLGLPFDASLRAFTDDRGSFVVRLSETRDDELARTADVRLPGMGVQARTAFHYLHRMAEHEQQHVRHLERTFAESG